MSKSIFLEKHRANKGVSKVLFSCHPDDFDKFFEELTDEILAVQDCSIYYLEDQNYIPEDIEGYKVQLSEFNLFVFPITTRFLSEPSRAMDVDFRYAVVENKYPILPILVEPNIYDQFNSYRPVWLKENEKYEPLQVLNKTVNDPTQDPYKVKLEKYLKSVLVDDETAKKIRDAFDAYIFLSYRKIDRKYAQEIMSLIHKNDFMRDIAIWYDEFLTPGESFDKEIKYFLDKSHLMTLVVTSNIYAKTDSGNDNYVVKYEYPNAINNNKPVLPIEATTDVNKEILKSSFKDIKDPINKNSSEELAKQLKDLLFKEGIKENNDSEHLYFIGLAYLNGIDTDRNPEKAINILEKSANQNFIPAIKELVNIYENGNGVLVDIDKAIFFQRKLIKLLNNDCYNDVFFKESLHEAELYLKNNNVDDAYVTSYDIFHKIKNSNNPFRWQAIYLFAECNKFLEEYSTAIMDYKWCIEIAEQEFCSDDKRTIRSYRALANVYSNVISDEIFGFYDTEMLENCCEKATNMYGIDDVETIACYNDLIVAYMDQRKYDDIIYLIEPIFDKLINKFDISPTYVSEIICNLSLCYRYKDRDKESIYVLYDVLCKFKQRYSSESKYYKMIETDLRGNLEAASIINDIETNEKYLLIANEIDLDELSKSDIQEELACSYLDVGLYEQDIKKIEKAKELYINSYEIRRELLGEKDERTILVKKSINDCVL